MAGKGFYKQGEATWSVNPGELLYCPPDTPHEYGADSTDPWTIYWLHVSGRRMGFFEKQLEMTSQRPVLQVGIIPDIVDLFRLLFSFFTIPSNDTNKMAIQATSAAILSALALAAQSRRRPHAHTKEIRAALAFMEASVNQLLDVDSIARQAGLSTFHFCRIFKQATGLTPMHYFNRMKIRKACSLVSSTPLKIKQIAFQLGFEDAHYFSRLFKNIMGFPPKECRGF